MTFPPDSCGNIKTWNDTPVIYAIEYVSHFYKIGTMTISMIPYCVQFIALWNIFLKYIIIVTCANIHFSVTFNISNYTKSKTAWLKFIFLLNLLFANIYLTNSTKLLQGSLLYIPQLLKCTSWNKPFWFIICKSEYHVRNFN